MDYKMIQDNLGASEKLQKLQNAFRNTLRSTSFLRKAIAISGIWLKFAWRSEKYLSWNRLTLRNIITGKTSLLSEVQVIATQKSLLMKLLTKLTIQTILLKELKQIRH